MAGTKFERLLPSKIVLEEVYRALDATATPVSVVCSANTKHSVSEVIATLAKLGVGVSRDEANHTDQYVFATIRNRKQAQKIDDTYKADKSHVIGHVWLDKKIVTCVETSQMTINAAPARTLFQATGKGVHWAILDTGIDIKHSWFAQHKNCHVSRQYDFTGEGKGHAGPHGTHVAGIVATIAPEVTLYDFKVIGKNGGSSQTIIRAMYAIRKMNFDAGEIVIHGANMSIGGPVPVGSYGCGWSPECQEADRLVASGVVVCVAAGNDGHKVLASLPQGQLEMYSTFVSMGITDPGNAAAVITVGSTHRQNPHTYGPSFFSSKGPTGDGRVKPDCLAPGEKIVSAQAGTKDGTVTMDGTSMATPHVSGAIALFLSGKPEWKGRAREVKEILLKSCTDLGRDRNFQGAGLVDVLRMIQSV